MPDRPMLVAGMRIVVTPDQPKMQLSPGDYVTPEFRAEMNAWLRSFFGTTNPLKDGEAMHMLLEDAVAMNERTYDQFRRSVNQFVKGPTHGWPPHFRRF